MNITQIDVLVHPDFHQMYTPDLPLHRRQKELRQKWDTRVEELKRGEKGVLIYFSNIPKDELEKGLEDETCLSNGIKREDVMRIKRYREVLKDRFVLFSELELPNATELKRIFQERGFTYEPNETKVYPYGEVFEACVMAWGYHIKHELDIPDSNYDFYTEGMSLTFADSDEIKRWREGQEREIPKPRIA